MIFSRWIHYAQIHVFLSGLIRKFLNPESTKTLVHAFVTSHLNYCNSLLFGVPKYQIDRLQKVLNAAARLIFRIPKFDHISPALFHLHWLPVACRVHFKLACSRLSVSEDDRKRERATSGISSERDPGEKRRGRESL